MIFLVQTQSEKIKEYIKNNETKQGLILAKHASKTFKGIPHEKIDILLREKIRNFVSEKTDKELLITINSNKDEDRNINGRSFLVFKDVDEAYITDITNFLYKEEKKRVRKGAKI